MSQVRGLGRRERVARKRHRRTVESYFDGSAWRTCKLGRKKYKSSLRCFLLTSGSSVGDTREGTTGARVAETER